jgi:hypothetical protein
MNLGHCIDGAAAGKLKPDPKFSGLSLLVVTRPRCNRRGLFYLRNRTGQLGDVRRDPARFIFRSSRRSACAIRGALVSQPMEVTVKLRLLLTSTLFLFAQIPTMQAQESLDLAKIPDISTACATTRSSNPKQSKSMKSRLAHIATLTSIRPSWMPSRTCSALTNEFTQIFTDRPRQSRRLVLQRTREAGSGGRRTLAERLLQFIIME